MLKYRGKLLSVQKIKAIVQSVLDEDYSDQKTYKYIYTLKNKGYLVSVKKDLFFVQYASNPLSIDEITQTLYRNVLKTHAKKSCGSERYVGGRKALEIYCHNYSIPESIDVYTPKKNATEVVLNQKKVCFKTSARESFSLRSGLKPYTTKGMIEDIRFPLASFELSIMESLYNPASLDTAYINELIKQCIRKQWKTFDLSVWEGIVSLGKYHVSINRLRLLVKSVNHEYAEEILAIIKKHSYVIAQSAL